jgi:hypothetical protein
MAMPKMSDRERLADLEQRQRRLADDVDNARRALRGSYAAIVNEVAVEALTEREFRDLILCAIRVGGGPAIAALKALSPANAETKPPANVPAGKKRRPARE